jgi:hypothetical protein
MPALQVLPDDRLYMTLLALCSACGGRIDPDKGREYARLAISETKQVEWSLAPGELDDLEKWGWVELLPPPPDDPDVSPVCVTENGEWWLKKWLKKNRKRVHGLLAHFALESLGSHELEDGE